MSLKQEFVEISPSFPVFREGPWFLAFTGSDILGPFFSFIADCSRVLNALGVGDGHQGVSLGKIVNRATAKTIENIILSITPFAHVRFFV